MDLEKAAYLTLTEKIKSSQWNPEEQKEFLLNIIEQSQDLLIY